MMLLPEYFECTLSILNTHRASSKRIQDKNDNFEWLQSLSIRTLKANKKLKGEFKNF